MLLMNHFFNMIPEQAKELLSPESLTLIEKALEEKISLSVEAALTEQDELYASKLETLVKAIDKDHTAKLKRVVESIDRDNSNKLIKIASKYEKHINNDAKTFKDTLVESISQYMEEYIDEVIPADAILEATKNNTAYRVLDNLRNVLAIDSALMQESFKPAIIDGKKQIEELTVSVEKLKRENSALKESYLNTKSNLILEQKTAALPQKKREYIMRVLGDKTPKFIEENYDYTLRLFEKQESAKTAEIKEEAFRNRQVKADAPVLNEKVEKKSPISNIYVSELSKYR